MTKTIHETIKQGKPFKSIEEQVIVNLTRTQAALSQQESSFFKQYAVTAQQYNVLRILRGAGKEGLASLEVAKRMIDRLPDITRLLERMQKNGWLRRQRSDKDRRVVMVHISDTGLQLLADTDKPLHRLNKKVLKGCSSKELEQLSALLDKARSSIEGEL